MSGRIAALGENLGSAREIVDATGRLVLPGGIDSHVHIAQPSGPDIVMADDFASATRSAAFGGNTMVLPFAMQQKGQSLREVVSDYHKKADGQCYVDVSFHLIIADATDRVLGQELPALVHDGYTSFKVFMTYEGLALSDMEMLNVMAVARDTGALVMIHAENYDAIRFLTDRLERAGKTAAASSRHLAADSGRARGDASRDLACRTHRCADHDRACLERRGDGGNPKSTTARPQGLWRDLSAISGADRQGHGRPQHGGGEVCLLAAAARRGEPAGLLARDAAGRVLAVLVGSLSVPLRRPQGQARAEGPHLIPLGAERHSGCRDKAADPVLRRRRQGPHFLNEFVALTSTNHAKTYGLYPKKGTIAVGADADIAIWDPEREVTISQSLMHGGSDYTPYEGIAVKGWPVSTMVRGKFVVRDGKLTGTLGAGEYVSRAKSELAKPAGTNQ